MVKIVINISVILLSLNTYAQKPKLLSNIGLTAGTFFSTQTKIENEETGNILNNYKQLGIKFGLNYSLENSHLLYSGGLSAGILPLGYQFLIKKEDRFDNGGTTYDYQDRLSDYSFYILSLPFKIGYQTLKNNANQKFWRIV
jgi:hypothetical protein